RLFGAGLRAIRQPLVIAEIIAGIALGPSLLGRVWPSASTALFPHESIPALSIVSKVGLVLFMFLVGLRFDFKHLRGHGRASVAISHAGIAAPFALGVGLAEVMYSRLSSPEVPAISFA